MPCHVLFGDSRIHESARNFSANARPPRRPVPDEEIESDRPSPLTLTKVRMNADLILVPQLG